MLKRFAVFCDWVAGWPWHGILLAAIFLICMFSVPVWLPMHGSHWAQTGQTTGVFCNDDKSGNHRECAEYRVVKRTQSNVASNECETDKSDRHAYEECLLVRYTGKLANYTFALFVATGILGLLALATALISGAQTLLLRNDFNATHRPLLRVRRINLVSPLQIGQQIGATIEAQNIGVSEAYVVEVGVVIGFREIANAGAWKYAWALQSLSGIEIPAGRSGLMAVLGGYIMQPGDDVRFTDGTHQMVALGIINYKDRRGAVRSTSFFRVFDRFANRFIPAPDDPWHGDREDET